MTKETRDKISNLQTLISHKTQRIAELETELSSLRLLRKAVSTYLDAVMVDEPTERHLEIMRYLVKIAEVPSGQVMKRG